MPDKEDINQSSRLAFLSGWQKPCPSFIKCNIGSSWIDASRNCAVAWLTMNHYGMSLAYSRRSYSVVESPLEAELLCFYWAVERLSTIRYENVVFESTSYMAGEVVLNPENFLQWSGLIGAIRENLLLLKLWSIVYVHKDANGALMLSLLVLQEIIAILLILPRMDLDGCYR